MDNLTKLYRIRKTCLEMLNDRSYLVAQVISNCSLVLFSLQVRGPHSKECSLYLICQRATGAYCHVLQADNVVLTQDELKMTKEAFRERFSDDPKKDDLTVLAPKQDDPTEQVWV